MTGSSDDLACKTKSSHFARIARADRDEPLANEYYGQIDPFIATLPKR
jgi:hypothetical protein